MKSASHVLATTLVALALSALSATADAHGRRGGGHWGYSPFWGGVGIGVGIGLGSYYYNRPYYPGYVIVDTPPVYYRSEPQPVPAAPEPVTGPISSAPPAALGQNRDG